MDDFEKDFFEFLQKKRNEMREKYNRVLPTGELLFNRFDKAKYINAGEKSSIYDTSVIMGDVEIGKNVWVGPYTILEGINGKLKIHDFVSINSGVEIYTHDSTKYYVSGGICPFEKGDVTVNSYTVIGSLSVISYGVTIGKHCIIGAGSYVNKDVSDYTIVAGTPAITIGKVQIDESGFVDFVYNK